MAALYWQLVLLLMYRTIQQGDCSVLYSEKSFLHSAEHPFPSMRRPGRSHASSAIISKPHSTTLRCPAARLPNCRGSSSAISIACLKPKPVYRSTNISSNNAAKKPAPCCRTRVFPSTISPVIAALASIWFSAPGFPSATTARPANIVLSLQEQCRISQINVGITEFLIIISQLQPLHIPLMSL